MTPILKLKKDGEYALETPPLKSEKYKLKDSKNKRKTQENPFEEDNKRRAQIRKKLKLKEKR